MNMQQAIRPAAFAGRLYPADPELLRTQTIELLTSAVPAEELTVLPKALVVPHAGYLYSGTVAANGYASLYGAHHTIKRVVLLGSAHRASIKGFVLPAWQGFSTPLGVVPVAAEATQLLRQFPDATIDNHPHAQEHSVEVQLPFLQTLFDDFSIIPLLINSESAEHVADLFELLWGGPETLFVISSDLSHFLSYDDSRALDRTTVHQMLDLRPGLSSHQACNASALNGLLIASARHALAPYLLDLRNSGDTAGDRERVVGYASLAFVDFAAGCAQLVRH